ncbi:MAG TPA: hypothetical protein PKC43_14585 [Phycisphaerales bacterium]|nr:hypothetical protein [Phycisphaerales bacterium]HMP38661.1 hypothetical protein [Phycisphaerales bacterium]
MRVAGALGAALLVTLGGCGRSGPQPKPPTSPPAPVASSAAPSAPSSGSGAAPGPSGSAAPGGVQTLESLGPVSTATSDPKVMKIAGLTAPKPVEWLWIAPTMSFRNLQYTVPAPDGRGEAADFIVSVFLPGDGGPIEDNLVRWTRQFVDENDRTVTPTRSQRTIDGMSVHLIDLEGRYMGMGAASARPGVTQLGAIIEAPSGNVYLRLLGPTETVEANRAAWERMLDGLSRIE